MRIAVLQAGRSPRDARARMGNYGQMFVDFFDPPSEWSVIDVEHGEFPDDIRDFDGYVITGSKASVYNDEPWIHRLLDTIREIHAQRIKLLGSCFGHQAVAQALGGQVVSRSAGWELGIREVRLTSRGQRHPGLQGAPDPLRVLESHQDTVQTLPPGGVVLGYSGQTPVEIFSVGEHILCLQGHPEFDADVIRELVRRMGDLLTPEEARIALESLALAPHTDFLHHWLSDFLSGPVPGKVASAGAAAR